MQIILLYVVWNIVYIVCISYTQIPFIIYIYLRMYINCYIPLYISTYS